MRLFRGFINFYGDFNSNSTELTAPLYKLTNANKKDHSIQMGSVHVIAFKEIKRRLCAAPQLAHPDFVQPFVLYTDASNIAVVAIMLQRDSRNIERSVSFFSEKLISE